MMNTDATIGTCEAATTSNLTQVSQASSKRSGLLIAAVVTVLMVITVGFVWKSKHNNTLRNQDSSVSINIKDLRKYGISLIGSTDAEFDSLATSVVPAQARDNVQALRSISVFLKNDTDHPLISYTVKWEMMTPDGKVSTETRDYLAPDTLMGRATNDLSRNIQPHNVRLISLAPLADAGRQTGTGGGAGPGVGPAAGGGAGPGVGPAAGTRTGNPFQRYVDSLRTRTGKYTSITISVDAVLFDDGRFAGPNTTGRFEKISAIMQAKRDLLTDFEHNAEGGKSLQIAFDNLNAVVSGSKRDLNLTSNPDDYYDFYKQMTAREMLALKDRFGQEEAAKRISSALHRDWPTLKRLT